jgi:hypothetical protein
LREDPSLITAELRSPAFHPEGIMSVLYEGDPPTIPVCYAEWMEAPRPLENISGTRFWGADFPTSPIADDVCSTVPILAQDAAEWIDGTPLLSHRHTVALRGPGLSAPLEAEGMPSILVEDFAMPAPGLAGEARRVRVHLPHDCRVGEPCPALFIFDGQVVANQFPVIPDTLRHRGRIPPVIQVVMDSAVGQRQSEYLADRPRNAAARLVKADALDWLLGTIPQAASPAQAAP